MSQGLVGQASRLPELTLAGGTLAPVAQCLPRH
jgi:hypothetical protein